METTQHVKWWGKGGWPTEGEERGEDRERGGQGDKMGVLGVVYIIDHEIVLCSSKIRDCFELVPGPLQFISRKII